MIPCPCCDGPLKVAGSKERVWYRSSGTRHLLIIRRLHCVSCTKMHNELPDVLIPYKRYGVESIEPVVDGVEPIEVAADDATLVRWRQWFMTWATYALGCLNSIAMRFQLEVPEESSSGSPQTVLQAIGREKGTTTGWLANVVRPIANTHLWLHTRSACLSAPP